MTIPARITPMLQQYLEIKSQHQDAILFYRLGDFYEMFFDDAVIASRILGITLTSRGHRQEDRIPMCGVPFHAAAGYLAKLVNSGRRVAVCEQVEEPDEAKGVVRREVVRVVTPGLVTDDGLLDGKSNRYLAATCQRTRWGLSFIDLSTGEFLVCEYDSPEHVRDEINRLLPSELLFEAAGDDSGSRRAEELLGPLRHQICLTGRPAASFDAAASRDILLDQFRTANLAGFGCDGMKEGLTAAGVLLAYVRDTQKCDLSHIEKITLIDTAGILMIDDASRRNLELTSTIIGGNREGSLLATLDFTVTPMGARLLKKTILFPLRDVGELRRRLHTVETLYQRQHLRAELRQLLGSVYDLERLTSRVVLGSANARDLFSLKVSIGQLPFIRQQLADTDGILADIHRDLDELADLFNLLDASIRDDAPVSLREGRLIRPGYHAELDELLDLLRGGKTLIASLEASEREKSGIGNLKVGFNKVFGYYFEISRGQLERVPDYFIRKQTLVNGERFITPELKEFEEKVLGAEEKSLALEYQLFTAIRQQAAAQSSRILAAASLLARLDFFACLAEAAARNHYTRPEINDGEELIIVEGRHPVIEKTLPAGRFVPNDIDLNQTDREVMIITGPNMAGKSTVLRQTALIVLMAQMGGFVPAAQATVGIVDRIFTRVGAMDDLRKAQSTFMVEMNETANILNNATEKSLVILDEIGRGTSTYDGLAIAWAVAEDLVNRNGRGVKTLFATHYHELTELAGLHERVKNYNIAVREWNDSIIFLHKLMPGGTNRSYGIQVASLAGVPGRVISRAKELLTAIENGELGRQRHHGSATIGSTIHGPSQLELFPRDDDPVVARIREIAPDRISPLEALSLLYELKESVDRR